MNGLKYRETKPSNSVELLVSCRDLADLDVFTKSDPMCVLFVKQFGQWKEYGRTEAIRSTLNPKFVESFVLEHDDTVQQQLMFSVYDIDSRSNDLRQHDFVGSVEVKLDDLVDEHKAIKTVTKTLRVPGDPKSRGTLCVTSESVRLTRSKVQIYAVGDKLDKVGFFPHRKPDTLLEIGRAIDSITFHPVYRTEVQPKSRHPWWRPFDVTVQRLCNDDWDREIEFSCWHVHFAGGPGSTFEMIGKVTTTLRALCDLKNDGHHKKLHLISPKKEKAKKKDTYAGTLKFYQFSVDMQYSLLDYIRGGMQLRLVIAVDFTASNGATGDSMSLHNPQAKRANQYLNAIESLGGVISRYDLQQRVAAFGFGAKPTGSSTPSYCFPLHTDTWVKGVTGVIEAYHKILPSLTFAGPTYVSSVVQRAIDMVQHDDVGQEDYRESRDSSQEYFVLLVITDGIINDVEKTVQMLVGASSLPLSVIFLGIGPTDFTLMEQFHQSLHTPLFDERSKKTALRPNTHFAAFKKDSMATGGSVLVVQEALAALSSQVLQYMKMQGCSPRKPRVPRSDPARSWVDPSMRLDRVGGEEEEEDALHAPTLSGLNFRVSSRSSVKLRRNPSVVHKSVSTPALNQSMVSLNVAGPICPTCGSSINLDSTT